jgi:hypothetical protein
VTVGPPPRACPGCGRPAPRRDVNPAWPFCSARCKLLDLGRWLGEDYRIPGHRAGDGAVPPPGEEEP